MIRGAKTKLKLLREGDGKSNAGNNHKPAGPESRIRGFTVVRSVVYFACSLCFRCIKQAAIRTFFVFSLHKDNHTNKVK
jgi:hypothetical protein